MPNAVEIRDGRELGLWWDPVDPGARKRKVPVRAIVLHWTGGVQGAKGIVHTLRHRRLSIHYTIEQDGTVTHHADERTTVCMHAGTANDWTIGVEIANRGRPPAHSQMPGETYTAVIHGRRLVCLRFSDEQIKAAQALCEHVAHEWGLPLMVPETSRGDLILDKLTDIQQRAFRGVLGHLHVSDAKIDPGADLLTALRDAWVKQ